MRNLTIKSSVELSKEQKEKLEKSLCAFNYIVDEKVSGIKIYDGEKLLDVSASGGLNKLKKNLDSFVSKLAEGVAINKIPNLLKEKLKEFSNNSINLEKCGKIIAAADGVIRIEGLYDCKYGELILVGEKGFALAMNIEEDNVGGILLSGEDSAEYGDLAFTTGKIIEVPVGYEFLGRVIDPLGNSLDRHTKLVCKESRKIEHEAPRIIDRDKVNEPLYTGLLAIDSMIPIGKGQRELIIGDRQTGKTSIAIDTIINQKDKNVYCVYVAIGQRSSSVNSIVKTLENNGAMAYTTVVLSTASDSAPLQYIAPYTGTALAEFFMHDGKDVLIIYDDLSKHAVAYRTISLLLKRPAGREAFPGDIFYIHSKLLERASKLKKSLGGGSITALPIIETQAGDISAYIPTNVISITDGQIYLEKELFNAGQRPAINVGLSVSRVGGAAQTKLMRKYSSRLRLDIAHYRELAIFSQFGSSLDDTTKDILTSGMKIENAIRQEECKPLSYIKEILYLFAISNKYLINVPSKKIKEFLDLFYNYVLGTNPSLCEKIKECNDLDEMDSSELSKLADDFISFYLEAK